MAYWEAEGFYRLREGEYTHITADDVLGRMLEVTGLSSLSALAERLGVQLPLLTDARRRNIIPVRWLQNLPHAGWILKGKGKGPC